MLRLLFNKEINNFYLFFNTKWETIWESFIKYIYKTHFKGGY